MIHFKNNRSGFSFIEAILAVAIVAIVLTPLFILQGSVLRNVARLSWQIQRIFSAKNFFMEAQRAAPEDAREFTLEKKIDDPEMIMRYEIKGRHEKSSLKDVKDIFRGYVTFQWEEDAATREDLLLSFFFKPEQKK